MTSEILKTVGDFAVLFDNIEQNYWVGVYDPYLRHQNGEPMYVFEDGYFQHVDAALAVMYELYKEDSNV